MKLLRRNTTEFEYLPYTGSESDVNSDGDHTGEFHPVYDDPITLRGNISTPSGHTLHQFYGEEVRYTHTLVMDNPNAPIDEYGMIRWKGDLYEISAVRPSLNALSVALRKCTKSISEPEPPEPEPTPEPEPDEDQDGEEP